MLLYPSWLSAPARPEVITLLKLRLRRSVFNRLWLCRLGQQSANTLSFTGKLALAICDPFCKPCVHLVAQLGELFDGKRFDVYRVAPRVESSRKVENAKGTKGLSVARNPPA